MTKPDANPLAKYAANWRDVDPDGARKLAAYLWHEHGHVIVMASVMPTIGWANRQALEFVMAEMAGERSGGGSP